MINTYELNEVEQVIVNNIFDITMREHGISGDEVDVDITMVDKAEIHALNLEMREVDRPTDVLSFPNVDVKLPFYLIDYHDYDINPETNALFLGEIIICREIMQEQALEYNHDEARECAFLTTHGLLHLLGYDHLIDGDKVKMCIAEDKILNQTIYTR